MEWNLLTAQNLALIDREIDEHNYTPAEYEIIRRVIYHTADFDYQSILTFSPNAIKIGASACVCRSTIIVDVPMVQAGIMNSLEKTFCNPIYSLKEITPSFAQKNRKSSILENLLTLYPGAICIIGEDQLMLNALLELLDSNTIKPSLIIATPPGFIRAEIVKNKLNDDLIPNIRVNNYKGGVAVAVSIFNALVDLAWLAYEEKFNHQHY